MKIFDGHNDILNKINHSEDPKNTRAFLERGEGHLDFPRATKAGFAGGFFAVYSSDPPSVSPFVDRKILTDDGFYFNLSPPLDYDYAHQSALSMIDLLLNIENDSSG
ncbi:MAG: membrane dipeptidase, partial [Anaerolineales bacterium]